MRSPVYCLPARLSAERGKAGRFAYYWQAHHSSFLIPHSSSDSGAGSDAKILGTNPEFAQELSQVSNDEGRILVKIGWCLSVFVLLGFQEFLGLSDDDFGFRGNDIIDGAFLAAFLRRVKALSQGSRHWVGLVLQQYCTCSGLGFIPVEQTSHAGLIELCVHSHRTRIILTPEDFRITSRGVVDGAGAHVAGFQSGVNT
jgi:hypothetical protein